MCALCIAIFCVALDNTIIATAIPHIAREFNSLDQIGWYGSSYFLTLCSFQLPFGRIYGLLNPKWLFLLTLGIFEIGSLVCALAQSSISFIAGSTPLEKRPIYISIIGSMFGIASISGPLVRLLPIMANRRLPPFRSVEPSRTSLVGESASG
ncbi:hypothetical protein FG05_35291 [Fusarium graminearum]|nr:hypothetical protein FG05_35291 [Fusarium graminearum]